MTRVTRELAPLLADICKQSSFQATCFSGTVLSVASGCVYLAGSIPSELATSDQLETLDVKNNSLTTLPIEWTTNYTGAANASLINVRLSFNKFTGPFPQALAYAPQLTFLVINNNTFSCVPTFSFLLCYVLEQYPFVHSFAPNCLTICPRYCTVYHLSNHRVCMLVVLPYAHASDMKRPELAGFGGPPVS